MASDGNERLRLSALVVDLLFSGDIGVERVVFFSLKPAIKINEQRRALVRRAGVDRYVPRCMCTSTKYDLLLNLDGQGARFLRSESGESAEQGARLKEDDDVDVGVGVDVDVDDQVEAVAILPATENCAASDGSTLFFHV